MMCAPVGGVHAGRGAGSWSQAFAGMQHLINPTTSVAGKRPVLMTISLTCTLCMQVRMLVWDDRSSTNVPVLKGLLTGVMGTFDEELRTWVSQNAPGVQLALVAREGDDKQSVFEGLTASACFSHHQVRLPSAPFFKVCRRPGELEGYLSPYITPCKGSVWLGLHKCRVRKRKQLTSLLTNMLQTNIVPCSSSLHFFQGLIAWSTTLSVRKPWL
jgi:hypothetical protein